MTFKTPVELAELEIDELEHAIKNKSDMTDYMSVFESHAAEHIVHILKSLVKENKALKAKQPITIRRRIAG